jgi:D-alanyl-lipoteichoic acid acyltransferase DltB (MBOAT superfamily)
MLFNSAEFIFLFLPITLLVFTLAERRFGRVAALSALILASAYFYASWNPNYFIILTVSVFGNYWVGSHIQNSEHAKARKIVLVTAITANVLLLFYFKYFMFTLSVLHISAPKGSFFIHQWALPLGISFWTFQQINFLLERYNRRADSLHLLDYVSIVLFFPHLVAGPIVRAIELGPQVRAVGTRERNLAKDLTVGTVLFVIGLGKKVLLADAISAFPISLYGLPIGEIGTTAGPLVAWLGILAYMLQLYFDFSGYCDMGMGLARMFGFNFPINFNSPLKARSFVGFWRTWHITLTRFFTDTLHTPLAMALMRRWGDVESPLVQSAITIGVPVLFTFFLTGIWHGAGGQFVVFGVLNGVLMSVGVMASQAGIGIRPGWLSTALTFCLVSIVFIFFRTPDVATGMEVLRSLFLIPGARDLATFVDWITTHAIASVAFLVALPIAFVSPNLYQLLADHHAPLAFKLPKKGFLASARLPIGVPLAIGLMIVFFAALYQMLRGGAVEFLYFQF